MRTSAFIITVIVAVFFAPRVSDLTALDAPAVPNAGATPSTTTDTVTRIGESAFEEWHGPAGYPVRLVIPSIGLDAPVEGLGLAPDGAMDVPDGRTNAVGWYSPGTVPGERGSAVMDAHVYAAFKKLRYALPGSDVYVVMDTGTTLHFRIIDSRVYEKDDVPRERLFADDSGRYLNLITCARRYLPSLGTYSHRLVAYAALVEEH